MNTAMPINEFAELEKLAQIAMKAGDGYKLAEINEQVKRVNMRFVVRDGKLYVETIEKRSTSGLINE